MDKPREFWIDVNQSALVVLTEPFGYEDDVVHVIDKRAYDKVVEALKGLLNDTQHSTHHCDDDGWCPVEHARKVLSKYEDKGL